MSQRVHRRGGRQRRRRGAIRVSGAVAFVAALLYWEQTALLYLLSTLAMCGLLLVVAFSDLEGRDKKLTEVTGRDETAAAGGGEMATDVAAGPERRAARPKRRGAA